MSGIDDLLAQGTGPPRPPIEPRPTRWQLPEADEQVGDDVVAIGGDLDPGTLLAAYRRGLFPMHLDGGAVLAWFSPDPRGVLPLDGLRVPRSLRRSLRRYEIRIDTAFDDVTLACADPTRPHGWIDRRIRDAYRNLHDLGWAHSVEAYDADGDLVGGLYGVAIGGLFAGESMFHRATDASKVALVALVDILREDGLPRVLDVQWRTDHLASLGVVDVARADYLAKLAPALAQPLPPRFT